MTISSNECPKCKGPMEQGFVLDNSDRGLLVSHWAKGPPQKSFWMRTKNPDNQVPIGMYRCTSCGYLEAYAREEFAAK